MDQIPSRFRTISRSGLGHGWGIYTLTLEYLTLIKLSYKPPPRPKTLFKVGGVYHREYSVPSISSWSSIWIQVSPFSNSSSTPLVHLQYT